MKYGTANESLTPQNIHSVSIMLGIPNSYTGRETWLLNNVLGNSFICLICTVVHVLVSQQNVTSVVQFPCTYFGFI